MVRHAMGPSADHDQEYERTRGIDPPTVPLQWVAAGAGSVPVRRPANRLGAMTFGVVVAGALMTIFPRTAALGLLLCLLAIVPAIVAYLRLRGGRATNRRSAVGALIGAPTFLVVGLVVLGATAPPPVATSGAAALPTTVAAAAAPASPAPPAANLTAEAPPDAADGNVAAAAADPPRLAPKPARVGGLPSAPAAPQRVVSQARPVPATNRTTTPVASACDEATHYVNSSGACVPRPVAAAVAPAGATAKCGDGTYSFSQHRSGTCSKHGGVTQWL